MSRPTHNKAGGRALRKTDQRQTKDAVLLSGTAVAFERRRPGPGYRHLVRRHDLERFIKMLPDWDELADGLHLVLLDRGDGQSDGWHAPGTIALRAWERELWVSYPPAFVAEHQSLLDRLAIEIHPHEDITTVRWTEPTARAYQLLHVFLHELGHHHDRMTTRKQQRAARGEGYAEAYASEHGERIWREYEAQFGL